MKGIEFAVGAAFSFAFTLSFMANVSVEKLASPWLAVASVGALGFAVGVIVSKTGHKP